MWILENKIEHKVIKPVLDSKISYEFSNEKSLISFLSVKTFLYTWKDFLIECIVWKG